MPFPIPDNELERLEALHRSDLLDTVAEKDFDEITHLASSICKTPISLISLIDADRQWFKSKNGLEINETPRDYSFCAHTIVSDGVLIVPNALEDARFADNPFVIGTPAVRFYAGIPLITRQGYSLGSLCVYDTVPRELNTEQKKMLRMLANQVASLFDLRLCAAALENANGELKNREDSYRVVAQSASDVFVTIDENNRILFTNPAAEQIFGYTAEELIGRDLEILIPERFRQAHRHGMQRYMAQGRRSIPWTGIIIPCLHKNGSEVLIEVSFSEHEMRGKRSFTAVMRDITEREQVKSELKSSEERYRFLAKSIPQQIWTAGPDGRIDFVNQRIVDYYGFRSEEEGLGMTWQKVIHPDDLRQFKKYWLRSMINKQSLEQEYRLLNFKGDYRWHLAQAVPMLSHDGLVLKWYGTNTDIHDRKMIEAAAREAEGYRNLFRYANDAIIIFDLETEVVIEANEKACELYGFNRTEFLGRNIKELTFNSERGDKYREELARDDLYQTFETVQYRADGTPIELLVNSSVIDYQNRKVILSINRDITERNRTDRLLVHNALHDTLTKLPNRALFIEHLRHAIERGTRSLDPTFAVLFLDFDRFKIINDSLGHSEGDNLLMMFAERLKAAVRPSDVVARLGGDEFTILLDELDDSDEALSVAERIHESLALPFMLGGSEVFISASIGIALSNSRYKEPDALLRDADIAMYRAKADGRAETRIFSQAMHDEVTARLRLENELRQAIERREFCVYYQPIIDLATEEIKGFEALVRWQHPVRGLISPIEFIPLAEETGLIIQLGDWVLYESCRQLNRWQKESPAKADLTVSVNLSFKQFLQPDLVDRVRETIESTNISADCLRLEITESYLMNDTEKAIEIMHGLRNLGIKLSIDDFGTGYSSLSYLHRFPLDYLKIDRSFVSRMKPDSEDFDIVQTIITLAKNLELKTIAEGIETKEHARQLKAFGCDYGQGFLYSRPVPASEAFRNAVNLSGEKYKQPLAGSL